jgi:signal transduction histidine kinase
MDTPQTTNIVFFIVASTIGMLVLCIVAILIFIAFYKRNMKAQKRLFEQEVAFKEQLNSSNLQTLEEERRRFAQDLHDEIGASLSAIRLYIGNIADLATDTQIQNKLQQVKQTIDQSMASTRRISHNILPPGLELMGLSEVVNELAKQFNQSHAINVKVVGPSEMPKLHFEKELMLYRVLQELLQNTLKHAKASEVTIHFSNTDSVYTINYTDNGVGFDVSHQKFTGLGMSNIESRIKIVGGKYTLKTAPNAGFELKVEVDY